MLRLLRLLFGLLVRATSSRQNLLLENLALRHQLVALQRRHPRRRLRAADRFFWIALGRLWSGWKDALVLVQPATVVRWHRAGFKRYWAWISRNRKQVGRKRISKELRNLIFRMVAENPTRGSPRIHGELKMLGFEISERTVLRWMRNAPRSPGPTQHWTAFLANHREAIAAMDFFTVPTITFGVIYCFFVISHDRRRILPSLSWLHSIVSC